MLLIGQVPGCQMCQFVQWAAGSEGRIYMLVEVDRSWSCRKCQSNMYVSFGVNCLITFTIPGYIDGIAQGRALPFGELPSSHGWQMTRLSVPL